MASLNSISCWDKGTNPQCGSIQRITQGDTIISVTLGVSHISDSSTMSLPSTISTNVGRKVRAAIWLNNNGTFNICDKPYAVSTGYVYSGRTYKNALDTNSLPLVKTLDDSSFFQNIQFIFNNGKGVAIPSTNSIAIGLISEGNSYLEGSLCFQRNSSGTLYFEDTLSDKQTTNNGSIHIYNLEKRSSSDSSTPLINVSQITCRTLSKNAVRDATASDPRLCSPLPTTDTDNIIRGEATQWNTDFDIVQGKLADVKFLSGEEEDAINVNNNPTSSKPLWIHSRSRIKIDFEAIGTNGEYNSSKLSFEIAQGSKRSFTFDEVLGESNSVIICPDDEGIKDNEPMDVKITRKITNKYGKLQSSATLRLSFYTYVTPEVKIAYPKNTFTLEGDQTRSSGNFVLWANEVMNNQYLEDRDMSEQICSALNISLSKDGGDDSGLPIYTRIYIAEYKGEYNQNGEFPTPSNEDIFDGSAYDKVMAEWTGVLLDDGTLLQLSGMKPNGYTWHSIKEDKVNWSDEMYMGIVKPDNVQTKIEFNDKPDSTGATPQVAAFNQIKKIYPHWAITGKKQESETVGDTTIFYNTYTAEKDRRMCFRAGYKYLVKVRRFHSAVAGILGLVEEQRLTSYENHATYLSHYRGGAYEYIGNRENTIFDKGMGSDEYYGARGGLAGDDIEQLSDFYFNGYPKDDSIAWIENNNKRMVHNASSNASSSGPIVEVDENGKTIYVRHTWVGPDDGSSGLPYSDRRIQEVYPGFSKSDAIIIDCVHAMTSRSNIITPRPATQEIGADHWITFGYRHLAKDIRGVEEGVYNSDKKTFPSKRNDLNADGSMTLTYGDICDSPAFGKTWGGNDNTLTRMCAMYQVLIDKALESAKTRYDDIVKTYGCKGNESCLNNQNLYSEIVAHIKIYIDHQQHPEYYDKTDSSNGGETTLIYSDNNYAGEYTSIPRKDENYKSNFNQNHILYDWYNADAPTAGKTMELEVFNHIGKSNLGDESGDYRQFGNTYRWLPVINNTTDKGTQNILTMCNTDTYATNNNQNFVNRATGEEDGFNAYYSPDRNHAVNIIDGYQKWFSANSDDGFPEIYNEYGKSDGYLYTSVADKNVRSIGINDTNSEWEDYGCPSQQLFSNKSTDINSTDINTELLKPKQHAPGKLFLRVPPTQDCENGTFTERVGVPTRIDDKHPLVRTSHYLWFRTYMHGKLLLQMSFWGKKHSPQSHEDPESGNTVYEGCDYGDLSDFTNITDWSKKDSDDEGIWEYHYPIPVPTEEGPDEGWGLTISAIDGKSYTNIFEVYGEDNNGLGRCLSADDHTALWFDNKGNPHNINDSDLKLDGGIEVPIRVRYTPLLQPVITQDERIINKKSGTPVTTKTCNVISLDNYKAKQLSNVQSDMWNKESFFINISYGMYRSAMQGCYISNQKQLALKDIYEPGTPGTLTADYKPLANMNILQQSTASGNSVPEIVTNEDNASAGKNTISWSAKWYDFNSDIFPAVGICNSFMVLLVPHNPDRNYYNQSANFYSNRDNFESWSANGASTVIVADMAKTESYKFNSNVGDESDKIDHKLRTLLSCEFNYYNLFNKKSKGSVQTSLSSGDDWYSTLSSRANTLKPKVWYDLVVVPIFTDHPNFMSEERSEFTGKDYDFHYKSTTAGSVNKIQFGANSYGDNNYSRYYGSSPLVVRKFLHIAESTTGGGGGGNNPIPTDPPATEDVIVDPPFAVESCILFPNVNNRLYDVDSGIIKECPGFWLNNTFRLICRAPHYRDQKTIDKWLLDVKATASTEVSLNNATSNQLTNSEECKDFIFSDCMLHFGKYDDIVMVDNGDGTFSEDLDDNGKPYKFNSPEFQQKLSEEYTNCATSGHEGDSSWLSKRGIFTMETHGNAFSKCSAAKSRNPDETRDVIKGGSLTSDEPHYVDRLVEFNPSMVGVNTPYEEGYYIQVRFLNAEYDSGASISGQWTAWTGGVVGGGTITDCPKDSDGRRVDGVTDERYYCKDVNLNYCVPVRDYNEIFTSFRHYIKESTPGSGIISTTADTYSKGIVNPYKTSQDGNTILERIVKGSGSESINTIALEEEINPGPYSIGGIGNEEDTAIVPSDTLAPITESGVTHTNTDYPYPPAIKISESGEYPNSVKDGIPQEVIDRHQTYWEMNYIDYIIRNMAKLYHSDWSEAVPKSIPKESLVTPEDVGWTKAKAVAYDWDKWDAEDWDLDISHLRRKYNTSTGKWVPKDNSKDGSQNDMPLNVNRYFRKNITSQDFDSLLNVLRHMVDFIRREEFTGKTNDYIDPKDDVTHRPTGLSVLPVSSDSIRFDKLYDTGMSIGHSMFMNDVQDKMNNPSEGKRVNENYRRVDSNYITNVMNIITGEVIKESTPSDVDYQY